MIDERRLAEVILHAGALDTDEQEAYLREVSGEDAELCAEVRRRLASAADLGSSFLGRPLGDLFATPTAPTVGDEVDAEPVERPPLEPEERYEREELLGEGGMARVYRARDHQLGRQVALKFLDHPEAAMRRRFLAEARSQARVRHDNVLEIYETGELDGTPYIAMRYVAGRTLLEIREGTPLEEKVRLLALVAEGLHAAHREGLLHRDVKPSNILIEETPDGLKPWVADFGIAAEEGDSVADRAGTPYFMAPERLRAGTAVDRRSDVYSLGVTMYQLFSGALPFDDTIVAEGLRQVLEDEPRSLEETVPDLPAELRAIVMKCLAKEPAERYASARAVAEDLRRYLDGEIVEAYTASLAYRLTRFAMRHRLVVGISAVALVLLLVASLIASVMGVRAVQANEVAQWRRGQAEDLIGYMLGDLREKLDAIGKLPILDDVGEKALEYFAAVPAGELSDDELIFRSKALYQIGEVRLFQGQLDEALPPLEESLSLIRVLQGREPSDMERLFELGQSVFWVGYVFFERAKYRLAREHFEEYMRISRELVAKDPEKDEWQLELAYAHSNLGDSLRYEGDLDGATQHFREQKLILESLLENNSSDPAYMYELAAGQHKLGEIHLYLNQNEEAIPYFDRELELLKLLLEAHSDPPPQLKKELGIAHSQIGLAFENTGNLSLAKLHYFQYRSIFEELVESDPTNELWQRLLCKSLFRIGDILAEEGALEASSESLRVALDIADHISKAGVETARWARMQAGIHNFLARNYLAAGQLQMAQSQVRHALEVMAPFTEDTREIEDFNIVSTMSQEIMGAIEEKLKKGTP